MNIDDLLTILVNKGGSDLHLQSNIVPKIRVQGILENLNTLPLDDFVLERLMYELKPSDQILGEYLDKKTADFRYNSAELGRFRVNVTACDGGRKITIRSLEKSIRHYSELGFEPGIFERINTFKRGLILITGPTNSGKSTTLASIIKMFMRQKPNIITLEDPIEYLLEDNESLITQRELGADFPDFPTAIRTAMRQDPDIIMVGEMRDMDTIRAGLLCAETGHLVLATLHTSSIESTLNRVILTFDANERSQIENILNDTLRCIIAQTLVHDQTTHKLKLQYEYKFFN